MRCRIETLADYTRETRRVVKLRERGDHGEALEILEDLIARRFAPPDLRDLWLEVAKTHADLGRGEAALRAFDEAVALERDTEVYKAHEAHAAHLAAIGRHRESLVLYEKLGSRRHLREGDGERFRQEADARKRALGSVPASDLADDFERAARLAEAEDFDGALRVLEGLLRHPLEALDRMMVQVNIANVHARAGRVDEALRSYDEVVAIEASHWGARAPCWKAAYLAELGHDAESAALFESVLAHDDLDDVARRSIAQNVVILTRNQRYADLWNEAARHSEEGRYAESLAIFERLRERSDLVEGDLEQIERNIASLRPHVRG